MNKEQQAIELLRRLRGFVTGSGPQITSAVYRGPAASLRYSADRLEAQEKLMEEIDAFLAAK